MREFWSLTRYAREIREFADQLVRGTLAHQAEIDTFIAANAINWSIERMAAVDRNILRCAVYELLYEDVIPPKVTINEALDIAKKYSTPKSSAFINGILDNIHHTILKTRNIQPAENDQPLRTIPPQSPSPKSGEGEADPSVRLPSPGSGEGPGEWSLRNVNDQKQDGKEPYANAVD